MEIVWSSGMVEDLCNIVNYLKKNKIGETLEKLADYFIEKHSKYLRIEDYTMAFSDSINPDKIKDAEFKLAYICELVNSHSNKKYKIKSLSQKNKKIKHYKEIRKFNNVYTSLSFMIKYTISKKLHLKNNKVDYKTFFLTNIIKDKIFPDLIIKNKDDPFLDVLNISYFLTKEIISFTDKDIDLIYKNTSLILNAENIDMSICSEKQVMELKSILKTRRTLYVRILLVLSFEISKIENILDSLWVTRSIYFENYEQFISVITSPLIETLIFLTSQKITSDSENNFDSENIV